MTFDDTVSGVNQGVFDGTGLSPTPMAGQLNSNGIRVTGFSDGSSTFGGTETSGDFARGSSSGGTGAGGLYAFDVGTGDFALGIQPGGSDFTPGNFDLKVVNESSDLMTELVFSYEVHVFNDQPRGQLIQVFYSTDDASYTEIPALAFNTPEAAGTPAWVMTSFSDTITGLAIPPMGEVILRWRSDDDTGGGSRDEIAFDDIQINATLQSVNLCDLDTVIVQNVSSCNDNGTSSLVGDDFFTADIVISYNALVSFPDTMFVFYGTSSDPDVIIPIAMGDSLTFHITDTFPADGSPQDLRIAFAQDMTCTHTEADAIPGIASCSQIVCPSQGDLILTEFMADPSDVADGVGEYVEFYNRSSSTIDLINMELRDLGTNSHIIGSSVLVEPDSFVLLGISSAVPGADYIYDDFAQSNSGSDEIFLQCTDSTVGTVTITGVVYDQGNFFGSGVAQELICLGTPSALFDQDDFTAATDELNYDADSDVDAGSPKAFGNTISDAGSPAFLVATADSLVSNALTFQVEVCVTDSNGTVPCEILDSIQLVSEDPALATVSMTPLITSNNGCTTFSVMTNSDVTCETLMFIASSDSLGLTDTVVVQVADEIYSQDWTDCGDWTIFNLLGSETWICDTPNGVIGINTFQDDTASVDWLVSPTLDLTTHDNPVVRFDTRERFSGPELQLLVSTDYAGSGSPDSATWEAIDFDFDNSAPGFAFGPLTSSGIIDVSAYQTIATTFAFLYEGPQDSVPEWQVDNWEILGCPKMCSIDTMFAMNISSCDADSGTFTASIHVAYNDAPSQGYLILGGDATDTINVMDMNFALDSGVYVFDSVIFTADGGLKTLTAAFTQDSTCTLTQSLVGTDVAPCAGGVSIFGGLVINEIWNDQSFSSPTCFSSESYIELLVVASLEDTTTQAVNLQNWIIDPSNAAGDAGHIRIKTGCLTTVPVGALIVIYNGDDPAAGITADEMDMNGDLVYFIPTNSACLEYSRTAGYPGTTYEAGDAIGDCFHHNLIAASGSLVPYTAETRSPHVMMPYSVVFDDLTFSPSNTITPGGSSGLLCGNIDASSSVGHDLMLSPGGANSMENEDVIEGVREEAGSSLVTPDAPNQDAINYAAFLADNGTATCDDLFPDDCVDTLIVTSLSGNDTLFAAVSIETDGSIVVDGDVLFSAPEILLQPGFEVPLGNSFTTNTDGCGQLTLSVGQLEDDIQYIFPSLPLPASSQMSGQQNEASER